MRTFLATALLATPLAAFAEPAFVESAGRLGLDFVHFSGMSGRLYTPELLGAGVALIDYDNDGDLDVYLGQGGWLEQSPQREPVFEPRYTLPLTDRLYRNDLDLAEGPDSLAFIDVTEASGLPTGGYNIGVATGDFDNDGWTDLYATNLGPNHLLRNRGDGTFEDVTVAAGADDRRFSVPATFFDYDGDGWLDLFVGNYHHFRLGNEDECFNPNGLRDYCGPLAQPAEQDRLLRNRGDGTFQDTTLAAGLGDRAATALGAISEDFDLDGDLDLYVANDLMANHLWLNQGDGTFVEDALLAGAALDGDGKPQASMGVVAGDLDGDGAVDLFMSHLLREYNTLYLNDGQGLFTDRSWEGGLVKSSWPMTGFGTVIVDYDGDGLADLFVANGAVHRIEEQVRSGAEHPLAMTNQLFRGLGAGRFEEVNADQRETPVRAEVSRGLAVGDLDNDGDPDLVITNNAGRVRVLLNQHDPDDGWIGLRLVGESGSDLLGARAALVTAGQPGRWHRVHTDGSFAAAADPRLLLRAALDRVDVRVRWPDGAEVEFRGVATGNHVTLRRGEGTRPAGGSGDR
ncbi:MAG: CRTAC1 family protein [Acidobacteriota bacterium]|nr:CRTAC1 family protein [Acidobacteriota bacterium]